MAKLTTKEAATILGVTVGRIHQLIQDGRIKADKPGRDYLINRSALRNLECERKPGWKKGRKRKKQD